MFVWVRFADVELGGEWPPVGHGSRAVDWNRARQFAPLRQRPDQEEARRSESRVEDAARPRHKTQAQAEHLAPQAAGACRRLNVNVTAKCVNNESVVFAIFAVVLVSSKRPGEMDKGADGKR